MNSILYLPRYLKRIIAITTDIFLCIFCTWLALILRLEEFIIFQNFNFNPAVISVILATNILMFGLYRTIFRFTGLSIVFTVLTSIFIYGFLYFLVIGVYTLSGVPRSIGVIQPMLLFFFIISSRLFIKFLLSSDSIFQNSSNKKNLLVYGAGEAGRQLVASLENSPEFRVRGFLDDNEQLHRQVLIGKTVYSPLSLEN